MRQYLTYSLFIILFSSLAELSAQEEETFNFDDFLEMSIEDLMSIEIVTKTQSEQNLQLPFSSFFIVTEKQIIENGYITLGHLLESIPGITIVNNGFYNTGGQRGLNGNFSQSLILINGREIGSLYSAQTFIANQFATNNIKQVEITQGPGTVLYGSDSFSGVINIVTKDFAGISSKVEVHAEGGSNAWSGFDLLFSKKRDKFNVNGYARLQTENGHDYESFVRDQASFYPLSPEYSNGINFNSGRFSNGSNTLNYHLKMNYGSVYLGRDFYSHFSEQKGIQQLSLDYNGANGQNTSMSVTFAGFNYAFSERSSLRMEYQFSLEKIWGVDRNHLTNESLFNALVADGLAPLTETDINSKFTRFYSQRNSPGSRKNRLTTEFTSRIPGRDTSKVWKGDWYLTLGNNLDRYNILELAYSSFAPHPDYTSESTSANLLGLPIFNFTRNETYGQVRKSILNESLFLTFGLRLAAHENWEPKLMLRSGAVYNLGQNTYLKASISQGRRFPSVSELILGFFDNQSRANETIVPSNLRSLDIGLSQRFSKAFFWELNAFNQKVEDQILATGPFAWTNSQEILEMWGLETQLQLNLEKFDIYLAYSVKDPNIELNTYRQSGFGSVSFHALDYLTLNTNATFRSKVLTEDGNSEILDTFEIPSYLNWNINLSSRDIYYEGIKFTFMVSVKNVMNTQQYTPNFLQSGPRQFINPGRQFWGRLILKV